MGSPSPQIVSYRHLLHGAIEAFLRELDIKDDEITQALAELVVILSRYREEGATLFPVVFVCDDIERLLLAIGGRDPIRIGKGPRSAETMRRAIKHCAPLATGAWTIFVEKTAAGFSYGVLRIDAFVLSESAIELLRASEDPELRAVGVVQLAEDVIELRGPRGLGKYVYLSGARTDLVPTPAIVSKLVRAATRDVRPNVLTEVRRFFRHVILGSLRAPHGTLVAVLPPKRRVARLFVDGLVLEPPIDVVHEVESYLRLRTEDTRAAVQGLAQILDGMLRSDGITVVRSDGAIVAYNVFVRHGPLPPSLIGQPAGGARRRTFETLRAHVGAELVAAYYRSQDGLADVATVPLEASRSEDGDEREPVTRRRRPRPRRDRKRPSARPSRRRPLRP